MNYINLENSNDNIFNASQQTYDEDNNTISESDTKVKK